MILTNEIANLICDLEFIIGGKCHNSKSYNSWTGVEGLTYRYPATLQRVGSSDEIKADSRVQYAIYEEVTPEIVKSIRYKMGANHLYIGNGLIDVLNELEKRYNIDFNLLEEEYQRKINEDRK